MHAARRLTLIVLCLGAALAFAEPDCGPSGSVDTHRGFVGYTRPHEARMQAAAVLADGRLFEYDGQGLTPGMPLHGALTGSSASIESLETRLSRHGEDHCVYQASLSVDALGRWEIWTTDAVVATKLHTPGGAQIRDFRARNQGCVKQGDGHQCVRSELLAVSDLDDDGAAEYWQTMPLVWDVGIQVLEVDGTESRSILKSCPGCSD